MGLVVTVPTSAQVFVITGAGTVGLHTGDLAGQPTSTNAVSFSFTVDTSAAESTSGTGVSFYEGAVTDFSLSIAGSAATFVDSGDLSLFVFDEYQGTVDGFGIGTSSLDAAVSGIQYDNGSGGTGSAFFNLLVFADDPSPELYDSTVIPSPFTPMSEILSVTGSGWSAQLGLHTTVNHPLGGPYTVGDILGVDFNSYTVSAVPEPDTAACLFGAMAMGLVLMRRPKRIETPSGWTRVAKTGHSVNHR